MAPRSPRATFFAPATPRGRLPHRISAQFGKASGTRAAHWWAMALFEWRRRMPVDSRGESEVTTGADVAQLVEQLTRNEQVVRSSRIVGSIYVFGTREVSQTCLAWLGSDPCRCRLHVTFKHFAAIRSGPEKRSAN
jgi:hypothetical protein